VATTSSPATINVPPLRHPAALEGGIQINNYMLDRVLGAGGFGITYKATEQFTDREVAIKEYLPQPLEPRGLVTCS